MKLTELKAAVYQLAQVDDTRQLKAQYKAIKSLDLRYKVSWEKALDQLRSEEAASKPKTTTEKKNQQEKTKGKKSEKKSTQSVDERPSDTNSPENFEEWASNPPGEFSELFAAADAALESFDEKLAKGRQLTKNAIAMANSLDEFAEATVDEAKRLAKAAQRAVNVSRKADLN